jgi:hypothetical protein
VRLRRDPALTVSTNGGRESTVSSGYLAGGFLQRYVNLESTGDPEIVNWWGSATDDQQVLGQGLTVLQREVTYGWIFLTDQATALGALKVVGGRQYYEGLDPSGEVNPWGDRSPFEIEVYRSLAYSDLARGWLQSSVRLYVVQADSVDAGFRIVGGRQSARDRDSREPFVTLSEWGDTSWLEQFLGTGQSWSSRYGWGFSQVTAFLAPG